MYKRVIAFRRTHPILSKERFYTDAEIRWFNHQQGSPNWADPKEKHLACLIQEDGQSCSFPDVQRRHRAEPISVCPSPPQGLRWHRAVDTSRLAPQDLCPNGEEAPIDHSKAYRLEPRTSAILLARRTDSQERPMALTESQ